MSDFSIDNYNNKVCIITPSDETGSTWLLSNLQFLDQGEKYGEERFQCLYARLPEVTSAIEGGGMTLDVVFIEPNGGK